MSRRYLSNADAFLETIIHRVISRAGMLLFQKLITFNHFYPKTNNLPLLGQIQEITELTKKNIQNILYQIESTCTEENTGKIQKIAIREIADSFATHMKHQHMKLMDEQQIQAFIKTFPVSKTQVCHLLKDVENRISRLKNKLKPKSEINVKPINDMKHTSVKYVIPSKTPKKTSVKWSSLKKKPLGNLKSLLPIPMKFVLNRKNEKLPWKKKKNYLNKHF